MTDWAKGSPMAGMAMSNCPVRKPSGTDAPGMTWVWTMTPNLGVSGAPRKASFRDRAATGNATLERPRSGASTEGGRMEAGLLVMGDREPERSPVIRRAAGH